jgi:hypothetical protein
MEALLYRKDRFIAPLAKQSKTPALLFETIRHALGLNEAQWAALHRDLPPTIELSQAVGECLPPATSLAAEIVAMREG